MAKKLILLILLLPLVLMLILFSATKTVSRNINVPVERVEYIGDEYVYLDLDKAETYTVEYAVYPLSAQNKNVSYKFEPVGNRLECIVEMNENVVVPRSAGMTKVTITTNDGGYTDSFLLEVHSGAIESMASSADKDMLVVGETTQIRNVFTPSEPSSKVVKYTSSDNSVATVNQYGVVKAVGKGQCTVTVTSAANEFVKSSVSITVENKSTVDLSDERLTVAGRYGDFLISMNTNTDYDLSFSFEDENGSPVDDTVISGELVKNGENWILKFTFADSEFMGTVVCKIAYSSEYETLTRECEISRVRMAEVKFYTEGAYPVTVGQEVPLPFKLDPPDADVTYTISTDGEMLDASFAGNILIIRGKKAGVTSLALTAHDALDPTMTYTAEIDIAVLPGSIIVENAASTYGIEGLLTIGKYDAYGRESAPFKLKYASSGAVASSFGEHITWYSDSSAVTVDKDGSIRFLDDSFEGMVSFYAEFSYGGVTGRTESYSVRCIADAVNVYNYLDLLEATRNGKRVVLRADIKEGFGRDASGNPVYTEMLTSYDKTYYKNNPEDAKVKILMQFKNDVYGNGYTINAHELAYGLDETGKLRSDALFRGPLNFVAMTDTADGQGGMVSVKAQDNIAFAVYEGVTLSNVILKSCDLTPDSDGQYDLTDLNYVGTTVEILGDGVVIEYSRLMNGRTVLRAFGDESDPEKYIDATVKNSVLTTAREFVVRIGSNSFKQGTVDDPSPFLDGDSADKRLFETKKQYNNMSADEKAAYDSMFIKTHLTVENSVIRDAGIFAVGVDTHFSGAALADGTKYSHLLGNVIAHWQELAKTSYGAKLTFKGDVRIYNWKEVDEIDSSTLIEITGATSYAELLNFEVKDLITTVGAKPGFENIIYEKDGKRYVHAGVAFFGGGKNYGVFEQDGYEWKQFNGYEISLADVDRSYLHAAAGDENFYFLLHDRTTLDFLPEAQEEILNSENAYSNIYK